jgi:mannose-6-phosphate isomerase-like protein (cupin superfamily)
MEWRDPQSGYIRRNVSPPNFASPIQLVHVELPAGARVAYETTARDRDVHEQIWVLEGRIEFTCGNEVFCLDAGDCLAVKIDRPTSFRNPARKVARYAVVIVSL